MEMAVGGGDGDAMGMKRSGMFEKEIIIRE